MLKFELALERQHKKLKSRLNKFNFSCDKKYELDDEDCYEDFNYKSILQDENKINTERLKGNINELINIKTDYFTNTSQTNIRENYTTQNENVGENDENSYFSDQEKKEKISYQHEKLLFYNAEDEKRFNFESDFYTDASVAFKKYNHNSKKANNDKQAVKNLNCENGIASYNSYDNENQNNYIKIGDIDVKNKLENINISSIDPMLEQYSPSKSRKSIKGNKYLRNQNPQQGKIFLMRNDSFSLPRTNTNLFKNTKNKK